MKKKNKKTVVKSVGLLSKLLIGISQFSLALAGTPVAHAETANSPLLAHTQVAQASVSNIIEAIKTAGGGTLTGANVSSAVAEAVASNPGVSLEIVAAALNQLKLNGQTLANAVSSLGTSFSVSSADVVTALVTDTYMNEGKAAANAQISDLSSTLGKDTVNEALKDEHLAGFSDADKLADIAPAAGDEGSSVYNG